MPARDIIVSVSIVVLAIVMLSALPKVWDGRAASYLGRSMTRWWPWDFESGRGFVRAGVVVGLIPTPLALGTVCAVLNDVAVDPRLLWALSVAFNLSLVAVAVLLVCYFSITWFNRPRFLVPPSLRDEDGAFAAWRKRQARESADRIVAESDENPAEPR